MNDIKAILFDLDGTLRASLPEGFEVFVEYARRVGVPLTQQQAFTIEREAHRYWAGGAKVDQDLARFDKREFWVNYNTILLKQAGVVNGAQYAPEIQKLFDNEYDPQDVIYVDSYLVLEQLRSRGYTVALVSNREGELDTYTSSVNLRSYFSFTLSGSQAGCYKPDPAIFRQALEKTGVPPENAIYVGDNFYADVLGAQAVGMHAILVDPRGAFAGFHDRRIRHLRDLFKFLEGS